MKYGLCYQDLSSEVMSVVMEATAKRVGII